MLMSSSWENFYLLVALSNFPRNKQDDDKIDSREDLVEVWSILTGGPAGRIPMRDEMEDHCTDWSYTSDTSHLRWLWSGQCWGNSLKIVLFRTRKVWRF